MKTINKKHFLPKTVIAFTLGALSAIAIAEETPPADGEALFSWLSEGKYKDWTHESAQHKSAGPHPAAVIAYLNSVLEESLSSGAKAHPVGSSAVKELYDAGGKLNGWAVSIKTDADSQGGKGWFWYEILGTTPDSRVVASANDVPLCYGCHTPGNDFVLIPFPLQ